MWYSDKNISRNLLSTQYDFWRQYSIAAEDSKHLASDAVMGGKYLLTSRTIVVFPFSVESPTCRKISNYALVDKEYYPITL
jgi:hypothetical protein